MARTRLQNYDRTADVIKGCARARGMTAVELQKRSGIPPTRFFRRMGLPGDITLDELRAMDREVGFTPEELVMIARGEWK